MARVFASTVINAPIDKTWKIIRDFGDLDNWHPAISNCRIENNDPGDKIGCIRSFDFKDGGSLKEQLVALDDLEHSFTYTMLESIIPIKNYVSTLYLLPIDDKKWTYAAWTAEFNCLSTEENKLTEMVKNAVFYSGFNGLKSKVVNIH
jgi:hypothetical protein